MYRTLCLVTAVVVLMSGAGSCSSDGPGGSTGGTGGVGSPGRSCGFDGCWEDGECRGGSLRDYCNGPCKTFDETLAEAEEREEGELRVCTDDGILSRSASAIGTCGEFRWIVIAAAPSLGGSVEFFDVSGALVGAEVSTDCNCFCDTRSFTMIFGSVPDCERELVNETCEPVPFGLGKSPLLCQETKTTTLFFDDALDPEDWEAELVLGGTNGMLDDFVQMNERVETGGDPDVYRAMHHTIDTQSCSEEPCGYTMTVIHRRSEWAYDPSGNGEIRFIQYTESQRTLDRLDDVPTREVLSTLVLFQENESGEEVRYEMVRGPGMVDNRSWKPEGGCTLTPTEFSPVGLDFNGRPISFGYLRRTTVDDPGITLTTMHDIDNFRIAVVPKD